MGMFIGLEQNVQSALQRKDCELSYARRSLSLTLISWVLPFSVFSVVHPLAEAAAIPGASFCPPGNSQGRHSD